MHSCIFQLTLSVLIPHTKPAWHNNVVFKGRYSTNQKMQVFRLLVNVFLPLSKGRNQNSSLPSVFLVFKSMNQYPQTGLPLEQWQDCFRFWVIEGQALDYVRFTKIRPPSGDLLSVCQSNFPYLIYIFFQTSVRVHWFLLWPTDRHWSLSLRAYLMPGIIFTLL